MNLPKRKNIRLGGFDYNLPGIYFITLCTKERKCILSEINVNENDSIVNLLTDYGMIAEKIIVQMNDFYANVDVQRYVIMPNHIHLLIRIIPDEDINMDGPSGRSVPTIKPSSSGVSVISGLIGTFKRFFSKETGENIWQNRSYDHIVRNDTDYKNIWNYIDSNPGKWFEDKYYM